MENADIIAADVKVHLDLVKKHDSYDCTFTCKGTVQIPCDRCLDPLDYDIDTVYHIIVEYGDRYDDGNDDVLIIPQSDQWLNVAYMLYDTILLEIPMRHVHPMGKCNRAMAAALSKHKARNVEDEEDIYEDDIPTGEEIS